VLSSVAQRRHGFRVTSLPTSSRTLFERAYSAVRGQEEMDEWEERLSDNTQTPVPDQASFRLAYPQFVRSLSRRDRRMASFLSLGNSATQTARKFELTLGRVSQLRQQWCRDWRALHDEDMPSARRNTRTLQPVA
jgi:hypothetical protein